MEIPSTSTDEYRVVWTIEEAQLFQNLLNETDEFCGTDCYRTLFQQIHTENIASHVQDWIESLSVKLRHDRRLSFTIHEVLFSQLVGCFRERESLLKTRSILSEEDIQGMNTLSQKMVELQNRLVANESGLLLKSELLRLVGKARSTKVPECHFFTKDLANLPEEVLDSPISDSNLEEQLKKVTEGIYPEQFSNDMQRHDHHTRKTECLKHIRGKVLDTNAIKIFTGRWPYSKNQSSEIEGTTQLSFPQDGESMFHKFGDYPAEIRLMIWKAALPEARVIISETSLSYTLSTQKVRSSKLDLQLICKESNSFINENYSLAFEPIFERRCVTSGVHDCFDVFGQDHQEQDVLRLLSTYINPDRDIASRISDPWRLPNDETQSFQYWTGRLFGLAQVKHLALDILYFKTTMDQIREERPIKMDIFHRLEASCPNLEDLIIIIKTSTSDKLVRDCFGIESFQGLDNKLIDITDDFLEHMKTTPKISLVDEMEIQDVFQAGHEIFPKIINCLQERDSKYWKRLKFRLAYPIRPRHDWDDISDMCNRYYGISSMFEELQM